MESSPITHDCVLKPDVIKTEQNTYRNTKRTLI